MRTFLSIVSIVVVLGFFSVYFPLFIVPCLLGWILYEFPQFRRVTYYEDVVRDMLKSRRSQDRPSTLLALLRLNTNYKEMTFFHRMIDRWFYVPAWVQQELGYFFLDRQELFCEFNLHGEWRASLKGEYFNLFRGVFSHGTLKQFIQAVRMYEAAVYALNSKDFSKAAKEHLSCNFDLSANDDWIWWISIDYPNSTRLPVLLNLLERLQEVEVSSHGKYWLRAAVHELELAEMDRLCDAIPNLGRNRPDFALN